MFKYIIKVGFLFSGGIGRRGVLVVLSRVEFEGRKVGILIFYVEMDISFSFIIILEVEVIKSFI